MSKLKENKTKTGAQILMENMNKYDGTNYVYDGSDDTINTEEEMIKKYTPKPRVQTWDLMKKTADKLFGDAGYEWSVVGAGATQMRINATGASLGSHVRVGLEDSLWDGPGNLAKTNADQVKRVVEILNGLSLEVATPDEARQMLGLKGKDKTNIK